MVVIKKTKMRINLVDALDKMNDKVERKKQYI